MNYFYSRLVNSRLFASLLILFSLMSCDRRDARKDPLDGPVREPLSVADSGIMKIDASKIVEGSGPYVEYSSLYSQVEYIPLETTAGSIVSDLRSCIVTDKYIYCCARLTQDVIHIFDRKGKFVKSIKQGRGPGELQALYDIAYDREAEELIALSFPTRVSYYSADGSFKRADELDFWARGMSLTDSGFAFVLDVRDNLNRVDFGNRRLVLTDKEYNIIAFAFPDIQKRSGRLGSFEPVVAHENDNVKIFWPLSDTVYVYSRGEINAKYNLDLGRVNIPWKSIAKLDGVDFLNYLNDNHIPYFGGLFHETSSHAYFSFTYNRHIIPVFFDKKTGMCLGSQIWACLLPFDFPIGVSGDSFVSLIAAEQVCYSLEQIRSGKIEPQHYRTLLDEEQFKVLEGVEPDDNPVLAIYKLKEF